jgi:hypothetical protein
MQFAFPDIMAVPSAHSTARKEITSLERLNTVLSRPRRSPAVQAVAAGTASLVTHWYSCRVMRGAASAGRLCTHFW